MLNTAASAREAVAGGAYVEEDSDIPSSPRGLKLDTTLSAIALILRSGPFRCS